jgi:hypothetical protein
VQGRKDSRPGADAVDQQRDTLEVLAEQIASDIRALPACGYDAAAGAAADQN